MIAILGVSGAPYDNWIGLALAVAALGYLIAVLVFPERF